MGTFGFVAQHQSAISPNDVDIRGNGSRVDGSEGVFGKMVRSTILPSTVVRGRDDRDSADFHPMPIPEP